MAITDNKIVKAETMEKFMREYELVTHQKSWIPHKLKYYDINKDCVYEIYGKEIKQVSHEYIEDNFQKIKPKLILQNEKIDIALAIKQLNEYQKELKNRADITLSRSEQQKCFDDIESSKKLQLSLSKIIDKLCELER